MPSKDQKGRSFYQRMFTLIFLASYAIVATEQQNIPAA